MQDNAMPNYPYNLIIRMKEFLEKVRTTPYTYAVTFKKVNKDEISSLYQIVLDPALLDPDVSYPGTTIRKTKWRKFLKTIFNTKWKKRYWYEGKSDPEYFKDCIINVDESHPDIAYTLKMSFGRK